MNFIQNPKAALKHYSTKALALAGSVQLIWAGIPIADKALLPLTIHQWVAYVTAAVAVAGFFGKFIDQAPRLGLPPINPPPAPPKDAA